MGLPRGVRLSVALDSRDALVELDLGMRRVGVQTPEEAVALACEFTGAEASSTAA